MREQHQQIPAQTKKPEPPVPPPHENNKPPTAADSTNDQPSPPPQPPPQPPPLPSGASQGFPGPPPPLDCQTRLLNLGQLIRDKKGNFSLEDIARTICVPVNEQTKTLLQCVLEQLNNAKTQMDANNIMQVPTHQMTQITNLLQNPMVENVAWTRRTSSGSATMDISDDDTSDQFEGEEHNFMAVEDNQVPPANLGMRGLPRGRSHVGHMPASHMVHPNMMNSARAPPPLNMQQISQPPPPPPPPLMNVPVNRNNVPRPPPPGRGGRGKFHQQQPW